MCGDVHAGSGQDQSGATFLRFLQDLRHGKLKCLNPNDRRLVILGDLFDYWVESKRCVQTYQTLFAELQHLQAAGWTLSFLLGNREYAAGRRLAAGLGCPLSWPALNFHFGTRHIRIMHGDLLCKNPLHRLYTSFMMGYWMTFTRTALPPIFYDYAARILRKLSAGNASYSLSAEQQLAFLDEQQVTQQAADCDALLIGHIHTQAALHFGGVDLHLVGDWHAGHGHWLEIDLDGTIHHQSKIWS